MAPQEDLGRHHLTDESAIRRVVDAAGLSPGWHVLDAGAGDGALTLPIADQVGAEGHVHAVEIEPGSVASLRARMPPQVEVIAADLLDWPIPPRLDAVVANPPFKIAAPLLERIVHARVSCAVLVLPRELIDRLTAAPGTERYGKLSVRVRLRAHVEDLGPLSRKAFTPPPAVPCGIVRTTPLADAIEVDAVVLDKVLEAAREAWDRKAKRAFHRLADEHRKDSAGLTRMLTTHGWADETTSRLPPAAFGAVARYLQDP